MDRTLKVALSAAAIALCAAIGLLVAQVRPFDVALPPPVGGARAAYGPGRAAGALPAAPGPPGAALTFRTQQRRSRLQRYETSLTAEAVWRFYAREMPRLGWASDPSFEAARRAGTPEEVVLSFVRPDARCIISIGDQGPERTIVTVLVLGHVGQTPDSAGGEAQRGRLVAAEGRPDFRRPTTAEEDFRCGP